MRNKKEKKKKKKGKKKKKQINLLLLFLSEVRWFADRRVVSTCQRRDTYRNLDFCLRAKRQDLAFVVIQNA